VTRSPRRHRSAFAWAFGAALIATLGATTVLAGVATARTPSARPDDASTAAGEGLDQTAREMLAGLDIDDAAPAGTALADPQRLLDALSTVTTTVGASTSSTTAVRGPGHLESRVITGTDGVRRTIVIYHPAVADELKLPVVYFLHGLPGTSDDLFSTGFTGALDQAFMHGVAPFLVVSLDGHGAAHYDTEWADSVNGQDMVETTLLNVVIPSIESGSPRIREQRAIAGFSMGGYGAMNLALRHPDVFGQVISLAGYFHVDDPSAMFAGRPDVIAANSPDQHVRAAVDMRILLADGSNDGDPLISGESPRMKALFDAAGIPATLSITGGGHDWDWVARQYPSIINFLEGGWT